MSEMFKTDGVHAEHSSTHGPAKRRMPAPLWRPCHALLPHLDQTMSRLVRPAPIPLDSEIHRRLPGADFFDSYEGTLPPEAAVQSALALALRTFTQSPGWVDFLMGVRNRVVALVGLKDLGAPSQMAPVRPPESYQVGDRVGIFTLRYLSDDEVILGDSDKHLDVLVSVCKRPRGDTTLLLVSTVVHVHNRLGRLYMLFVGPAHKLIAPATLRSGLRRRSA